MSPLLNNIKDPNVKRRHFDILAGARTSDLEEIDNALKEDVNSITTQDVGTGETALHITCRLGFLRATNDLLNAEGVDFAIADNSGADILDAAAEGGHPGIMDAVALAKYPHLLELRNE
ncbi:MAG: hypothetical protein JKY34_02500 [Kordiimonadaceae bacterium]|nr:hypothetical protein [Kordiimonadaceae bacterium]